MIIALSVLAGLVLAVGYEVAWVRTQEWVFGRWQKFAPLFSVLGFFLRLVVLGLVFLAAWRFTPLNLFVTALAFAAGFTVMSVLLITRMTKKKGPGAVDKAAAGSRGGDDAGEEPPQKPRGE